MLKVFAKNVKKIAASKASFHVSFNLYEGYMDCLDEIKSYCLDNFGALPQVAIMRDQRSGMKIHSSADFETYKKFGGEFKSPMFEFACENFLVNRRKYFCHAGQTSWFLDLATGNLARCYSEPPYFNAYDDLESKIPLVPVGRNCRAVYCINASFFVACGNIPEIDLPSYTALRDRPEAGWHKQTIKDALGKKFTIKLPKVLLLGDSISLGYRESVRENLRGVMQVYYPPENGRMAAYTFRALYEWSRDYAWSRDTALVYWNNGLWDVARIFGDEPQTPLPEYENLIGRTYRRLKYLFPKAQIIFATTTPVLEETNSEALSRYNADIDRYNEAAARIVMESGGIVHDLHGAKNFYPPEAYQDGTHFKPQVYQFIAKAVSDLLLRLANN